MYKRINVSSDLPATDKTTVPQTQPSTFPEYTTVSKGELKLYKGSSLIIELSSDEEEHLSGFEVSNDNVVSVDSGGRLDALDNGKAVVTASFSDFKKYTYSVNVEDKPQNEYDGFSTCIIANSDTVNKNKNSDSTKNLYKIQVNRKMNCVTVYTYDDDGNYTIPIRAMVCSCGKNNGTITGDYDIYFKNEWHALYNDVFGQYVSGFSGDYLFHSVPYYSENPNRLEVEEFNKLGYPASLGCVRMAVADTKWIYDNCPVNTEVTVYDDNNPGPLGKPEAIKITDKSCGWDPTDSNSKNPYNNKKPRITGTADITIKKNESFDPMKGVKAFDTCSNDITDKVKVTQNVIVSKAGIYKVTYEVTDAMHRSTSKTVTVEVKNK